MTKLIADLSILTTIPEKTLTELLDKVTYCICDAVKESELQDITTTEIDVGIGTLYIKHEDSELKYKFIPSDNLSKDVIKVINTRLNLLEKNLETSLSTKFKNVYKKLL